MAQSRVARAGIRFRLSCHAVPRIGSGRMFEAFAGTMRGTVPSSACARKDGTLARHCRIRAQRRSGSPCLFAARAQAGRQMVDPRAQFGQHVAMGWPQHPERAFDDVVALQRRLQQALLEGVFHCEIG